MARYTCMVVMVAQQQMLKLLNMRFWGISLLMSSASESQRKSVYRVGKLQLTRCYVC